MLNTIGKKIAAGFAVMTVFILVSGLFSGWQSAQLASVANRVRDIRGPTIDAALKILIGVNQSQSSLKSWVLYHNDSYRKQRQQAWNEDVWPAVKIMLELAPQWTSQEDRALFRIISDDLRKISDLQDDIENMRVSKAGDLRAELEATHPVIVSLRGKLEELVETRQRIMDQDLSTQASLIRQVNIAQVVLILLGALIGTLIGFLLIKTIAGPIQKAVELADRISNQDFSVYEMIVGFEEVNRLGMALERMRESLDRKSWLSKAQISFNEGVRAVSSFRELGDVALSEIGRSLKALCGVLYIREENTLKAIGGFAYPSCREPGSEIKFGEGLVGQAVAEKRLITTKKVEGFQMNLSTMVGEVSPSEVLALPLVLNHQVVGAMELGVAAEFKDHHKEFLILASEAAAISLNSLQKGLEVKNLLAETQSQSEELQSQHEELRNANDELQARQEELQSFNEELEVQKSMLEHQKVALDRKNQELENAKTTLADRAEELDRVSRYKSDFLANMSHELRTPLNSQLILSKLLEDNKEGNLTDKQREFAKIIHSTGLDLLQLINDILDLSKVEAGKLDLEVRDASIQEIVKDCERDFKHMVEAKGLKFSIQMDSSLPATMQTDPHRLLQVLKNFLSNAVKFTSKGEIALKVDRIDQDSKSAVAFTVSDTGIGIPKNKQEAVFQAFEQVDSSIGRQFGGTGLGLAISQSMSALLGGRIQVESQVGVGSRFSLILPINHSGEIKSDLTVLGPKIDSLSPLSQQDQALESRSKQKLMLIIEDDPAFAKVLAELAEEKGFDSILARDGSQGIRLAKTQNPSCILLDYRLPEMDGLNVLRELKNHSSTKNIPVHMISIEDRAGEAQKLGATGYLVKPVSAQQILEVIGHLNSVVGDKLNRVLVVEDDPVQREDIVRHVSRVSLNVTAVSDGKKALEVIASEKPFDGIIVDLSLPDMSGLELLKCLNQDEAKVAPPTIVYTAKDLSREEEEALMRYSNAIIIKGVRSGERLLDELSLFLNKVAHELPQEVRTTLADPHQPEEVFEGKEILLVDDDVRNIFSLSSALEGMGFKISLARNGQEALEALNANPKINLVLMDIMMPIMDGYEATQKIRESTIYGKVPVIALTAKAMKNDREACIQAGANDYLAKPVNVEKLLNLLRVWLA